MNKELEFLTNFIRDDLGYDGPLEPDTKLLEEHILDSFSVIQVILVVQDEFDIEFDPEELVRDNLSSLAGILALMDKHLS